MTILPKKKHPDGKKNDTNSSNDLRHSRSRNNCARTSGERANRSTDEINESSVYRGGNLELRGSSESSSNGKRRYRNSTNEYRRRDEAGYNSEDEYDASNSNEQPTEEVEKHFEKVLKEKKGFVIKKTVEDGACLFRAVGKICSAVEADIAGGWSPKCQRI